MWEVICTDSWGVVCPLNRAREELEKISMVPNKEVAETWFRGAYGQFVLFKDGTIVRHIPMHESFRGCRFNRLFCVEDVDPIFFRNVVMPLYTGKYEDIVWI